MRFYSLPLIAAAVLTSLSFAVESPKAVDPAMETAAKEWLVKLFDQSKKVNGPEQKSARAALENALDWDQVAKTCLGEEQWKKQAGKNRTEFRNLLRDVVLRTAFSRMDKFWDGATYTWEKSVPEGKDGIMLRMKFSMKEDTYALDYYMQKTKTGFIMTDLAFEDLRYSVNINEQLSSFLKEKPFSALLVNLKKRRDELAAGKKG